MFVGLAEEGEREFGGAFEVAHVPAEVGLLDPVPALVVVAES